MDRLITLVIAGTVRDATTRDAVTGDFIEEHAEVTSRRGRYVGFLWTMRQLLASFPHLAALHASDCMVGAKRVATFYATLMLLVALSTGTVMWLAYGLAAATTAGVGAMVAIPASMVCCVLTGAAGAAMTRRAPLAAALAAGVMCTGIGIASLLRHDAGASSRSWIVILISMVPASLAGGLLRVRHLTS